ncbi:MAG: phosphoribosylglycinamide formyltransferase, partial [Homavirus sp.]
TNLQAIIDACHNKVIHADIVLLISNRPDVGALTKAQNHNIPTYCSVYKPNMIARTEYDKQLAEYINTVDYDLIVCAGWMHLLSKHFLNLISKPIINLHPALPGQFPGKNSIVDAYNGSSYCRGDGCRTSY